MSKVLKSPVIRRSQLKKLLHIIIDLDLYFYITEKGIDPNIHLALKDLFLAMTARQAYLKPKRIDNLKLMLASFDDIPDLKKVITEILNGA